MVSLDELECCYWFSRSSPCNNFVKANVTFNIFTITVVINSLHGQKQTAKHKTNLDDHNNLDDHEDDEDEWAKL